jgi:hypothetical protein
MATFDFDTVSAVLVALGVGLCNPSTLHQKRLYPNADMRAGGGDDIALHLADGFYLDSPRTFT